MVKKILILFLLLTSFGFVEAQTFSMAELDMYSGKGKTKDVKKAKEIGLDTPLNNQYEFEKTCILDCSGQPKAILYDKTYKWIVATSSNPQSTILEADTVNGLIIARLFIPQIAKRTMGDNHYNVSIRPLLRFDFKDGKVRFSYSLDSYYVLKKTDEGGIGFVIGNMVIFSEESDKDNQLWPLRSCYPFTDNPSFPKVTASRALVNTVAVYNILKERLVSALNTNKNDEDW